MMKERKPFLFGCDISHHNYRPEVLRYISQLVKCDGFVIMKATEGKTYVDKRMAEYASVLQASTPEPLYGFYHYARPENNLAADEAYHFCNTVREHLTHAILCLDVEGAALTVPRLDEWCSAWALAVEAYAGIRPLIYCSRAEVGRFKAMHEWGCGLWVADWSSPAAPVVPYWQTPAIWQFSAKTIDCDIFYGSRDQFLKYAAPAALN